MSTQVKEVLMTIHEEIRSKEEALVESTLRLQKFETNITNLINKHKAMIVNKLNEAGKPYYPNAEKRELQLESQLMKDSKYKQNSVKVYELKKQIDLDKIEIKYLYNKQSNFKAITRLNDSTPDDMLKS